tara:strand:+ start:13425 stop:13643 length:219 start_codon:yes stop_codon:yes gene_type:complete
MTLYKSSKIDQIVIISSSVYLCSCGHTETTTGEIEEKECLECGKTMSIVSSSTETKDDETDATTEETEETEE